MRHHLVQVAASFAGAPSQPAAGAYERRCGRGQPSELSPPTPGPGHADPRGGPVRSGSAPGASATSSGHFYRPDRPVWQGYTTARRGLGRWPALPAATSPCGGACRVGAGAALRGMAGGADATPAADPDQHPRLHLASNGPPQPVDSACRCCLIRGLCCGQGRWSAERLQKGLGPTQLPVRAGHTPVLQYYNAGAPIAPRCCRSHRHVLPPAPSLRRPVPAAEGVLVPACGRAAREDGGSARRPSGGHCASPAAATATAGGHERG